VCAWLREVEMCLACWESGLCLSLKNILHGDPLRPVLTSLLLGSGLPDASVRGGGPRHPSRQSQDARDLPVSLRLGLSVRPGQKSARANGDAKYVPGARAPAPMRNSGLRMEGSTTCWSTLAVRPINASWSSSPEAGWGRASSGRVRACVCVCACACSMRVCMPE
jgi:hypothetical protein